MDELEREVLDNLRPEIVERLDPQDNVLQFLREKEHVTDIVYRRIVNKPVRAEQSRELISEVKRKGIFNEFIDALKYKNSHIKLAEKIQTTIYNLLEGNHFKNPSQVHIMCGKAKKLSWLSFKLRVLSNDGDMKSFNEIVCRIKAEHGQDADFMFRLLDSEAAKQRTFFEDLGNQVHGMEQLVPYCTNSEAAAMTFLTCKGSSFAMKKDFQNALQVLEMAKGKSLLVKPCLDTARMMYTYVNVLMEENEAFPTPRKKDILIRNLTEGIEVHFAHTKPEIRNEFNRIFYLKLAFCYLGIGVFGKVTFMPVTDEDVRAARFYIRAAEEVPGKLYKRRSMFILFANAVLIYRSGDQPLQRALQLASEAAALALIYGFKKELPYINDFSKVLQEKISMTSSSIALEENMDFTDGPSGQEIQPSGQEIQPSGQEMQPSGQEMQPSGQEMQPSGQVMQDMEVETN